MLNGSKEDVEVLKSRMEERRLRAKLEKVPRPGLCPQPLSLGESRPCPAVAHALEPVATPQLCCWWRPQGLQ